jgi:phenylpropionate dioxygenase-like ring-hydroxylating dioxygenase large terminal subunit
MSLSEPLRQALFAATGDDARMLPLEVYRSAEVLELEHERILAPAWHCVGRSADIPTPGDHLVADIPCWRDDATAGVLPVLVARGDDGAVRAFHNACSHRGAPLATTCGNVSRFTCPYHAWVFRLDGSVVGAPYVDGEVDQSLGALPLKEWNGFLYVSADVNATPLAPRLAGLDAVLSRFRLAEYVPVHQQVETWDTNWKLLVENFMDTYHVFRVHRATFGAVGDSPQNTTMHPGTDDWTYHVALDREEMAATTNTSLEGDWRRAVVLASVFPTHVMQVQPDYLWYLQIRPLGTGQLRVRWDVSVAPDVLAAQPDRDAYVASLLDLLQRVNAEDKPVVVSLRRAAEGPQFERGPLSKYESNVVDFDRHVVRRLTD